MKKFEFHTDNKGRPVRTFRVCGACGSMSTAPIKFLGNDCDAFYVCRTCDTTLVLVNDDCDTCRHRIDCLMFPNAILMCETSFFFPVGVKRC